MTKGRMEAFSDGVFAVIITIMVLEMKPPRGTDLAALQSLLPVFFSYVLSFVYVGIYWNNHHHLLQAAKHVTGGILWANLHVLFWLSLTPFVTAWMGENHFAPWPVALYGVVLLFSAMAYFLLTKILIAHHGKDSKLAAGVSATRVLPTICMNICKVSAVSFHCSQSSSGHLCTDYAGLATALLADTGIGDLPPLVHLNYYATGDSSRSCRIGTSPSSIFGWSIWEIVTSHDPCVCSRNSRRRWRRHSFQHFRLEIDEEFQDFLACR
jgi:uncharacterized membrane protein